MHLLLLLYYYSTSSSNSFSFFPRKLYLFALGEIFIAQNKLLTLNALPLCIIVVDPNHCLRVRCPLWIFVFISHLLCVYYHLAFICTPFVYLLDALDSYANYFLISLLAANQYLSSSIHCALDTQICAEQSTEIVSSRATDVHCEFSQSFSLIHFEILSIS